MRQVAQFGPRSTCPRATSSAGLLLTRYASTVALSALARELRAELDLRALCATTASAPSPHQRNPLSGLLIVLLLLLLIFRK